MKDNNNLLAVPNLNIPPEAVEAGLRAFTGSACDCNSCRKAVIRTIRAALAAWPGMTTEPRMWRTAIILPITTENPDAEA